MTDPIGAPHSTNPVETHEPLRRLPWTGPEGKAEYVTPGEGVINQIADSTEAHIIGMARDDAAYALAMVEQSGITRAELRSVVRKLAETVKSVAYVAELRGERLDAPAARALEEALRTAFRR
ncbi:hypothetical protein [Streptomyces pristinaespiralis]|uniref:hypothetical protein n=1 Tax=Streptomyces pristinaespiralis TaxID=38300 RepID=UPI003838FE92